MATHLQLWQVCRNQEDYDAGTDTKDHELPDCSCGCKFFHPLLGEVKSDWGICSQPQSPRAGLLTFEHMGCQYFERGNVEGAGLEEYNNCE
jgi:hypothetical protein